MQDTTPDNPPAHRKVAFLSRAFAPRRVLMNATMVVYCVALFLVFDFAWSSFTQGQERARAARACSCPWVKLEYTKSKIRNNATQ